MLFILIMLVLLGAVEAISYYNKSKPKAKKSLKKKKVYVTHSYGWLFVVLATVSLVTIGVYAFNASLYSGPHFLLGFLLGIPIFLIIFGAMAHTARAIFKNIYISPRLFTAAIIVGAASCILASFEIYTAISYNLV